MKWEKRLERGHKLYVFYDPSEQKWATIGNFLAGEELPLSSLDDPLPVLQKCICLAQDLSDNDERRIRHFDSEEEALDAQLKNDARIFLDYSETGKWIFQRHLNPGEKGYLGRSYYQQEFSNPNEAKHAIRQYRGYL